MWQTYSLHVMHMWITCVSHIFIGEQHVMHMFPTCYTHDAHIFSTCNTHVFHMWTTCYTHVIHINSTLYERTFNMCHTCFSHVIHMCTTCYFVVEQHVKCPKNTCWLNMLLHVIFNMLLTCFIFIRGVWSCFI